MPEQAFTPDTKLAEDAQEPTVTADELRSSTRGPNRNVALMLLAVVAVFMAAAFGVGFLALYAPF